MRVHRDRTVKFDAFVEKQWNWWRPKGKANKAMGHSSPVTLMKSGYVTKAGKAEGFTA